MLTPRGSVTTVAALAIAMCCSACMPPMANLQSARTLGPDESRIAGYAGTIKEERESGSVTTAKAMGFLIGVGGDWSELQFRMDRLQPPDTESSTTFLSLATKFRLVDDVLALHFPVGFYWGSVNSLQLQPGAIATLPVSRYLQVNTAARVTVPLQTELDSWVVTNLGLGLSTNVERWAIMPEMGYAMNISRGSGNPLYTFGVGVTFYSD